jgi:hypothetical protein
MGAVAIVPAGRARAGLTGGVLDVAQRDPAGSATVISVAPGPVRGQRADAGGVGEAGDAPVDSLVRQAGAPGGKTSTAGVAGRAASAAARAGR